MMFYEYGRHPFGYMTGDNWELFFLGRHLIGIGLLLLAGWVIYRIVKKRKADKCNSGALDALKILYVSGKIDEDEYLYKKEVLARK
ncbi:MAG: hypothetical protein PHI41_08955 [Erysipelotrichaceae bacterium]|nr:hypothetical protein [Erysipelotrichaceae bacterium]MDD3810483.1 hypothetical protein [Erysipelotrichaceae bacterium]